MRLIQIIPERRFKLYAALVRKEAELFQKNRGTFYRSSRKMKNAAKWAHKSYKGWVWIERGLGDVVVIELQSKADDEWQLLHAFLGFIDRHFGAQIQAVNIQYY
jgi:hypothetical protein